MAAAGHQRQKDLRLSQSQVDFGHDGPYSAWPYSTNDNIAHHGPTAILGNPCSHSMFCLCWTIFSFEVV